MIEGRRENEATDAPPGGNEALVPRSRLLFEGELIGVESLQEWLDVPSSANAEELLSAAVSKEGPAGLARVDGVFTFALARPSYTHLYRDPSGLRALYWGCTADERPVYSTAPLEVPVSQRSAPRLSRDALHEYLRLLDVAAPRTVFHEVQSVEAGVLLTISAGSASRSEVIPPHSPRALPSTFGAAVDVLAELLEHSVAQRIGDAHSAASFLSGGVDSALICALAARQGSSISALTVGFDGPHFDEATVAARIAAHQGLRHQVLRFGRQDYLSAFDRLARGMDQPMADPATMATVLAFDHCARHFDVVLDGTGADEAVGAMPPRHETLMRWRGFTRVEIEELCGEPVSLGDTQFYRTFARFPRQAHYERYSALLNAMPCDRLTQAMRLTGLRVRFPFCARDVDGFLRQLPTEWRHVPGQPKRILRELLARYVPRELWEGPKQGFTFPLHDFLAGDSYALVRQHVLDGRWLSRGLLRTEVVRRYAQAYIGGDRRLMFRVWALAVLGAWLDKHEDLNVAPPRA